MKKNPPQRNCRCLSLFTILIGLYCMSPAIAFAQAPADVKVTLKAQKVLRGSDGKEVLKVAERAFPGEIIQYDAFYKNAGGKGVKQLQPTLPIPRGLEYLPDSANPAPAQASLDGKNFAPLPLKRTVTLPDGQVKDEMVPSSEYRALRWELGDLESGKTALVSARARITTN